MESGPPTPNRPPEDEPERGAPPPPGTPSPSGPPPSPQAPAPAGGPPAPTPPGGPQAPVPPPPPGHPPGPVGPETPPYGGPAPAGGWQQPVGPLPGWAGQPLASWWSRVGATVIDGLILLVASALLIAIVIGIFAAGSDVGGVAAAIIALIIYFVISIMYSPLLMAREGAHNGQTWGKQAVGIRVVRDTGQRVDIPFGLLREIAVKLFLFGFIGGFFLSIPTILDWLWPLWDDENRCLHDMLVKTHVMRT